ncbi:MAG: cysteine--tRNA ligase [Nitrosopumilaceae archaeon]|nr:cysteine--tRNA ligase [Nitrosopumilaceae archaeon]
MKIHDTLSGDTLPLRNGPVRIYLCGVTVYDDTHIGHARTIVVFDVLRRFLADSGRSVTLIQNFTDIDDKIIDRAAAEGADPLQLAERYIARYHEDFDRLHVKRADAYPRATAHMDHIISMTASLVESGHAYVVDSGVYYSVESFPQYGRLSGKDTGEMMTGVRIEPREDKRRPLDFALWKRARSGPLWDSPWGPGRPGWHIECSAMSLNCLGEDFEIHGGGRDLIFPHHENEIAQSEGHTGGRQARIWMHTGMVTISGQKMSKSLGNIKSTGALLDRWGPNVLRLFCLSGHYSKPIDYSAELLAESLALWRRLEACRYTLEQVAGGEGGGAAQEWAERFDAAMASDLNTHGAIAAMTEMAKSVGEMAASGRLGAGEAAAILSELDRMMGITGLRVARPPPGATIDGRMAERRRMRLAGRYAEADAVREELRGESVDLLDYSGRTVWVYRERIPGVGAPDPA